MIHSFSLLEFQLQQIEKYEVQKDKEGKQEGGDIKKRFTTDASQVSSHKYEMQREEDEGIKNYYKFITGFIAQILFPKHYRKSARMLHNF